MKKLFHCSVWLLIAAAAQAQQPAEYRPMRFTPEQQARMDSARTRNYPPGTPEGVTAAELQEYDAIIARHKERPDMSFFEYAKKITPEEQDRLRALFARMNRRQQLSQHLVFMRMDPPHPEKPVTEAMLEQFRDSTQFRVRRNFKPVPPEELAGLKAADIWWHDVNPSFMKMAGSSYFTRQVDLELRSDHERNAKHYQLTKDTYQMVGVGMRLRSEQVERPAN